MIGSHWMICKPNLWLKSTYFLETSKSKIPQSSLERIVISGPKVPSTGIPALTGEIKSWVIFLLLTDCFLDWFAAELAKVGAS